MQPWYIYIYILYYLYTKIIYALIQAFLCPSPFLFSAHPTHALLLASLSAAQHMWNPTAPRWGQASSVAAKKRLLGVDEGGWCGWWFFEQLFSWPSLRASLKRRVVWSFFWLFIFYIFLLFLSFAVLYFFRFLQPTLFFGSSNPSSCTSSRNASLIP